jgi:hypothetical protein
LNSLSRREMSSPLALASSEQIMGPSWLGSPQRTSCGTVV